MNEIEFRLLMKGKVMKGKWHQECEEKFYKCSCVLPRVDKRKGFEMNVASGI